jgi:molybdopterin molybdotransferase
MAEKSPVPDASVADVWRLLDQRVIPLEAERVPLAQARGRLLRAEVKADADQPSFDRSAMDGYAFIPSAAPAKYRVIGTVKAGEVATRAPGSGEALRIFTGAALPAPNLAVLMQEEVRVEGEFVHVDRRVEPGENVRLCGSDAHQGDVLLATNTFLSAVELALLASVGEVRPLVNPIPRVAHATTGDEIVPPDTTPGPGQIRNSNQFLIAGLLQGPILGFVPAPNIHQEHWGDDPARAAARLASEPFASADVVLISGGASVGEHDYAARILEGAGYELPVRKINSRPGRPLLVGFRGHQIAFGLPGNPVSHFVCYHLFVHYALARLRGFDRLVKIKQLALLEPLLNCANRRPTYWPAALKHDKDKKVTFVRPLPWNNSGHLAALIGVNALIVVPPDTKELPAGSLVDMLFLFGG